MDGELVVTIRVHGPGGQHDVVDELPVDDVVLPVELAQAGSR